MCGNALPHRHVLSKILCITKCFCNNKIEVNNKIMDLHKFEREKERVCGKVKKKEKELGNYAILLSQE